MMPPRYGRYSYACHVFVFSENVKFAFDSNLVPLSRFGTNEIILRDVSFLFPSPHEER